MSDELDNLEEIDAQYNARGNEREPDKGGRIRAYRRTRVTLRQRAVTSTRKRRPPITLAPDGK